MGILEIISGLVLIACSVVIILLVLVQQPSGDMSMLGGIDPFGALASKSADAKKAQLTMYAGIAFFVVTIIVSAVEALS